MKRLLSLFIIACICLVSGFSLSVYAGNADDPFVLIPEAKNDNYKDDTKTLGEKDTSSKFFEEYNKYAETYGDKDIGSQFASGIMNWDTILTLLERVVKFLANGALVVGAAMIIYAGYLYVASVFAGDYTSKANEAIKRAVIGIIIVIFSYAIIRIVLHAFL